MSKLVIEYDEDVLRSLACELPWASLDLHRSTSGAGRWESNISVIAIFPAIYAEISLAAIHVRTNATRGAT